jgi:hypothetical protein
MKTAEQWYNQLETYHSVNEAPMICLSPRALKAVITDIQNDSIAELKKEIKTGELAYNDVVQENEKLRQLLRQVRIYAVAAIDSIDNVDVV